MSYDVSLVMFTGHEEVEVADCGNYTCNVYPMLRLAFDEPESGIYCLEGSTGQECLAGLRKAITHMEQHEQQYSALNPTNSWGSYLGCLQWLRNILSTCEQHPLATLRVT